MKISRPNTSADEAAIQQFIAQRGITKCPTMEAAELDPVMVCEACGEKMPRSAFAPPRSGRGLSKTCKACRHAQLVKYAERREDAIGDAPRIPRIVIWQRDNWKCGICSMPIDRKLTAPDPYSPSVDHIVPLSRGGKHEESNLQAAHLVCNLKKARKIEG